MPDKPNYTLPTIPAGEVAKWYPFAVVRTIGSDGRYVHSVHETLDAEPLGNGVDPRSVYLLAGEVPGAAEYVAGEDGRRGRGRWSGVSRIAPAYERDPDAIDLRDLRGRVADLGWALA